MSRKRNIETLNKAYRVRFIRENYETVAFIILMGFLFIAFVILILINFELKLPNFGFISKPYDFYS